MSQKQEMQKFQPTAITSHIDFSQSEAQTLLIADDEPGILQLLKDYFEMQDYRILEAANGFQVLELLSQKPDLILLDVAMPLLDGFEVCERIREHVSCPILFLTAKIEETDRIKGLMLGGDDYISKPFLVRELVIKVQRLLKGGRPKTAEVQVGPYTVHLEKHLVYCGGESISLTVKEYDLLLYLAANRGHVLKRGDILDAVWGYTFYGSDRVVDDTIRRLRKKLPGIEISTLYGLGYCLTGERHESLCD